MRRPRHTSRTGERGCPVLGVVPLRLLPLPRPAGSCFSIAQVPSDLRATFAVSAIRPSASRISLRLIVRPRHLHSRQDTPGPAPDPAAKVVLARRLTEMVTPLVRVRESARLARRGGERPQGAVVGGRTGHAGRVVPVCGYFRPQAGRLSRDRAADRADRRDRDGLARRSAADPGLVRHVPGQHPALGPEPRPCTRRT